MHISSDSLSAAAHVHSGCPASPEPLQKLHLFFLVFFGTFHGIKVHLSTCCVQMFPTTHDVHDLPELSAQTMPIPNVHIVIPIIIKPQ